MNLNGFTTVHNYDIDLTSVTVHSYNTDPTSVIPAAQNLTVIADQRRRVFPCPQSR